MEKWSNIRGEFSGGEFHKGEGNLGGEFLKKNEYLQNGMGSNNFFYYYFTVAELNQEIIQKKYR